MTTTAAQPRSAFGVIVRRPSFWFLVLGSIGLGVFAVALGRQHRVDPLPPLATVPAFTFTNSENQPVTSESLKGQVWIANFIFTRCPSICPAFTAKMASIQAKSADELRALKLVSFSVDPEFDTPEKLAEYAVRFKADTTRWTFLTGKTEDIKRVSEGVMQPLDRGDNTDLASLVHGSFFLLIDRNLQVRGFYKFNEPGAVEAVLRDAQTVLEEK